MIIGIDARPLTFPNTGIGRYTKEILSRLIESKDSHFVLFSHTRITDEICRAPNVEVVNVGLKGDSILAPLVSAFAFTYWSIKHSIDLFWSPRHHLPLLLPGSIKTVVTIHDVVWKRFPDTMDFGTRALETAMMPRSLRRADSIVCVSDFTAREVSSIWPKVAKKVSTIYSGGLDDEVMQSGITDGFSPYFLFVGTQEPRKNLNTLLEAYSILVGKYRSAMNLVLVSNKGWGNIQIEEIVESFKLQERVTVLKGLNDGQLAEVYNRSHSLLLPSVYEGCGLPVIEALRFGIPSLVAKDSAPMEMAGPSCITFDPLSAEDIARAMLSIESDSNLYESLSAKAKQRSREFSWRNTAQRLFVVFSNSLANQSLE